MREQYLYLPTTYIPEDDTRQAVFLGGPIQGAANWQSFAIEYIHSARPDILIASPRRNYLPEEFDYYKQIDWETYHLQRAGSNGVILFWLAREMVHFCERSYAQTTRVEVSDWKEKHIRDGAKLAVGIEVGFSGERYIRYRFIKDCPDITIVDNLEETCKKALVLLS